MRRAALRITGVLLASACAGTPDWVVADPAEHGLDPDSLEEAVERLAALRFVRSFTLTREGTRVIAYEPGGFEPDVAHDVRSVSKSLLSAMVGIAVDRGLLATDDRVISFFPQYDDRVRDPRVRDITVAHLLQMRGGLPDDGHTYHSLRGTDNWIRATLAQLLVADPGAETHYTTFGTHLLSGVLTAVTGTSTLAFAQRELCEPAGMRCEVWESDPQGIYWGGNAMRLTPDDMARFGELYAGDGALDGDAIVPGDWVERTLEVQAGPSPEWGAWRDVGYGELWWTGRLADVELVFALGHGGQYIIVDRERDIVITTTAAWEIDFDTADARERSIASVLGDHVLGAVVD